jgi:Arc/MetJ-type ribon-helix-helix transcriptional regulator
VKLSIRLFAADLAVLDQFVQRSGLSSRSAAVRSAVGLLRDAELGPAYAAAWKEWEASGEHIAWEATAGDGLTDAVR